MQTTLDDQSNEEVFQRSHDELKQHVEAQTSELQRIQALLSQEVERRQQAEKRAEERLQFETILSELVALFVNIPLNEVDASIHHGLQRIIEVMDVDRGSLFAFSADATHLRAITSWQVAGAPPPAVVAVDRIPGIVKNVFQHELVIFSRLADLPEAFSSERVFFQEIGLKSGLAIPLVAGGAVLGMLAFGVVRQEKTWNDDLVKRLRLLGEIFANILVWRRKEEELQQSKDRFRRFMDHTPAVIYIKDEAGRHIYGNKTLQEAFTISLETFIGTTSYDFFPNEIAERLEADDRLVRTQKVTKELDEWSDTSNGERRWWKEVKFPLPIDAETTLLGGIGINITALKQAENTLQERLRFEQLLFQLSATFTAHIPTNDVDQRITEALRQLAEFFEVDRAVFVQRLGEAPEFQVTHLWASQDLEPDPVLLNARVDQQFPWIVKKMLVQEVIALSRFEDVPAEAVDLREYNRHIGLTSLLIIPTVIEETVAGFMELDTFREPMSWSDEMIQRLRLVGEMFVSALIRKQTEKRLKNSERKFRLLFEKMLTGCVYSQIITDDAGIPIDFISLEANEAYENIMGLKRQDVLGKHITEVHPTIREGEIDLIEEYGKVALHGQELRFELYAGPAVDKWFSVNAYSPEKGYFVVIFDDISERKQAETQLREAFSEIQQLKDCLEQENVSLREQIELKHRHPDLIGASDVMRSVLRQIEQVAETPSTVLITGETGTGKEVIARTIHQLSARKDRPMVTVNCAALPATLIENELFGREKGAYTGATSRQIGRVEMAHGSTLFLDEIGELPLELQVKLLRVLQEGQFERLGSTETITVDVRVIAATNRDLDQEIQAGRFREDLYYRLSVFPIVVPPLRERREDIPRLAWAFIEECNTSMGKAIDRISRKSLTALQRYAWPGNVRELRNVIEHAMIISTGNTLRFRLPKLEQTSSSQALTLEEVERNHILDVLEQTGWRIRGRQGAAGILGLKAPTLYFRMQKLGIQRPQKNEQR